jgi:hypothetical protein
MRRLLALPPGAVPTRDLLEALREGWGNVTWSADVPYLADVATRAAAADRPVLECGSGLTTLLLAALAARRGIPVWVLEHDPRWSRRVAGRLRRLRRAGLSAVSLRLAPLRPYEGFSWYAPPLEEMPTRFGLVVCDGPPGDTPGGRYGLMPVMGERLAGAVILLDDADRPGERKVLDRWAREHGAGIETVRGEAGVHAVVHAAPPAAEGAG